MAVVGDIIGHYEVRQAVTAGASPQMFRATDQRSGREVALKVWELDDTLVRERGMRELSAVRSLNHPNIVNIVDVIETDDVLAIAWEWYAEGSLEARLERDGTLPLLVALQLGIDVLSALEHAHERGIVHRDIKPANVLIGDDGSFVLTDFGAFGQLDDLTATTRAGEISGTPLWMAPEQLAGDRQSRATDLYGVGLLLFRAVYGRLGGTPDTDTEGYLGIARTRSAPIQVPPSPIQDLLQRLLDPSPHQRPSSAALVREDLRDRYRRAIGSPAGVPMPAPAHGSVADDAIASASVGSAPCAPASPAAEWVSAPTAESVAALGSWTGRIVLAIGILVGAALLFLLVRTTGGDARSFVVRALLGLAIAAVALVIADRLRRAEHHPASEQANAILYGIEGRSELSATLMKTVDDIVAELRTLDAKVLGVTLLAMASEYENGKESSDRQAALLNVATLMEKLNHQLSPWYVRHKEQLALAIALFGASAGVITAASGFLQ